jgi:hypothetical protein
MLRTNIMGIALVIISKMMLILNFSTVLFNDTLLLNEIGIEVRVGYKENKYVYRLIFTCRFY